MVEFQRLFITGFMGAGKTTVGSRLADKLQWGFLDIDAMIEEKTGMDIPSIFKKMGESSFRKIEKDVIAEVCSKKRVVVALGGGAIMDPANLSVVKKYGFLIWLKVSLSEISRRLKDSSKRPLFSKEIQMNEKLYFARQNQYQQAHLTIENDGKVGEIVDFICRFLEEKNETSL